MKLHLWYNHSNNCNKSCHRCQEVQFTLHWRYQVWLLRCAEEHTGFIPISVWLLSVCNDVIMWNLNFLISLLLKEHYSEPSLFPEPPVSSCCLQVVGEILRSCKVLTPVDSSNGFSSSLSIQLSLARISRYTHSFPKSVGDLCIWSHVQQSSNPPSQSNTNNPLITSHSEASARRSAYCQA